MSVGSLAHLIDSQTKNLGSHEFATVSAPMLSHDDLDKLLLQLPHNSVEDFLNETIADPDEHSSTACKVQYDSDTVFMQVMIILASAVYVMIIVCLLIFVCSL